MNTFSIFLSGLAVGGAMTVPGVSGGSAAMILGIYDKLVRAMSRVFTEPKQSLPLLAKFSTGAVIGLLLLARLISFLLTTPAEIPLRFLFLGAVAGGVPMIFRCAGIKRLTPGGCCLIVSGAALVILLSTLPEGLFQPGQSGLLGAVLQLLGGFLLAAALILPGISASHFLYILGIYDEVVQRVGAFDLISLLPMGIGLAAGLFLTARAVEALIERHRSGTFLIILGFILASMRELLPTGTNAVQTASGIICAIVGFIAVYKLQAGMNEEYSAKK